MRRSTERIRKEGACRVFGPQPEGRRARIMVTPGGVEAFDPVLVRELVAAGMDVLRINCAFGTAVTWEATAENLRRAVKRTGRHCALFMDLAGPKIRTVCAGKGPLLKSGSKLLLTTEGVTIPSSLERLRVGDNVWFDDGRFGGVVKKVGRRGTEILFSYVLGGQRRLQGGKSINVPGRDLGLPSLTARDLKDLSHAAEFADLIGLSYIHTPADVAELQGWLRILGREDAAIVLKIENLSAFRRAPEIIRQGRKWEKAALLVARGDLTVEAGAEWLAAIQVRLLRLGRAAGVPTIIATGILASLVEQGLPTRAELIDAVAAREADCVMLHGGPYVLDAVRLLNRLLRHEKLNH